MAQVGLALIAGVLFGASLAISGMDDPTRVRAFLDVFGGAWDPTLAFVMGGAILPMAVAWTLRRRIDRPLADNKFALPATRGVTGQLIGGSALFGVGWGIAGLCPGPAIANLAIRPASAIIFVVAMVGGLALYRAISDVAGLRKTYGGLFR